MRWMWMVLPVLMAAQTLQPQHIYAYLDPDNPFVQEYLLQLRRSRIELTSARAPYDPEIKLAMERKIYPLSTSLYGEATLSKLLSRGIRLMGGWRKATGVQEYNNIKTSSDGEMRVGVMATLEEMVHGYGLADLRQDMARKRIESVDASVQERLSDLYLWVFGIYYDAIAIRERMGLYRRLLKHIARMEELMEQKVAAGVQPRVVLEEFGVWRIRMQRQLYRFQEELAPNENSLKMVLQKDFELPDRLEEEPIDFGFEEAVRLALSRRAIFKELHAKERLMAIEKRRAALQAFGRSSVALFGVYDLGYRQRGWKASVSYSIPLGRSRYRALMESVRVEDLMLQAATKRVKAKIEADLRTLYRKLDTTKAQLALQRDAIRRFERIERLYRARFLQGVGTFLEWQKRRIDLLEAKMDLVDLKRAWMENLLEIRRVVGELGRRD